MKLVIISFLSNNSDPRSAPRVQNIISAIESDSYIIVLNKYIEDKKIKNIYYKKVNFKLPKSIILFLLLFYYKLMFQKLVIIVHHLDHLPVFIKLNRIFQGFLIVNCHEYYPEESPDDSAYNFRQHNLASIYLKKCDYSLMVNNTIREMYIRNYDLDPDKSMAFYNSKKYVESSNLNIARRKKDKTRLIHHGLALRGRRLEEMIHAMDFLPSNFELTLMLVERETEYLELLYELARNNPRIRFKKPVDYNSIVYEISEYNIGVYYLDNSVSNHEYASPNKLFEFIQARLPVVTTPNYEMKNLVQKYQLGVVAKDFSVSSFAQAIIECTNFTNNLPMEYFEEKARLLCLENELEEVRNIILNEPKYI